MKKLILVLAALLCMPGGASGMRGMEKEEGKERKEDVEPNITIELLPAPATITECFIQFNDLKMPVMEEVLNQFDVYRKELNWFIDLGKKNKKLAESTQAKKIIWNITEKLALDDFLPAPGRLGLLFLQKMPAHREEYVKINNKIKRAQEAGKDTKLLFQERAELYNRPEFKPHLLQFLTQAASHMIGIATGAIDPVKIDDDELLLIIQMAHSLENLDLMHRCNFVLMDRFVGPLEEEPMRPVRTFGLEEESKFPSLKLIPGTPRFLYVADDKVICCNRMKQDERIEFERENYSSETTLIPGTTRFLVHNKHMVVCYDAMDPDIRLEFACDDLYKTFPISGTTRFLLHCKNKATCYDAMNPDIRLEFAVDTNEDISVIPRPGTTRFIIWYATSYFNSGKMFYEKQIKIICFDAMDPKVRFELEVNLDDKLEGPAIQPIPETTRFLILDSKKISCYDYTKNYSSGKEKPLIFEHDGSGFFPTIIPIPKTTRFLFYGASALPIICFDLEDPSMRQRFKVEENIEKDKIVLIPETTLFLVPTSHNIFCFDYTKNYSSGKEKPQIFEFDGNVYDIVPIPNTSLLLVNNLLSNPHRDQITCFDWMSKEKKRIFTHANNNINDIQLIPGTTQFLTRGNREVTLWDIYPHLVLNREQIELCFRLFTSKKPVENLDRNEIFLSLPGDLQRKIMARLVPQEKMEKKEFEKKK